MKTTELIEFLSQTYSDLLGGYPRLRLIKKRLQANDLMPKYGDPVSNRDLSFFLLCAFSDTQLSPKAEAEAFFNEFHLRLKKNEERELPYYQLENYPTTLDELELVFSDLKRLFSIKEVRIDVNNLQGVFKYRDTPPTLFEGPKNVFTTGIHGYNENADCERVVVLREGFFKTLKHSL